MPSLLSALLLFDILPLTPLFTSPLLITHQPSGCLVISASLPSFSNSTMDVVHSPANQPTSEEVARIRRRRRLARKTPEQRRKLLQYQRRHNEKDGRLFYCDYCDLFVSSRQKTWAAHLRSARHMDNFRAYYNLASQVESVWMGEMEYKIEQARAQEVHRRVQQHAGRGAATPLGAQHIAPGIVVGGSPSTSSPSTATSTTAAPAVNVAVRVATPSVRVGGVVMMPTIRVGGKVVPPPPPPHVSGSQAKAK